MRNCAIHPAWNLETACHPAWYSHRNFNTIISECLPVSQMTAQGIRKEREKSNCKYESVWWDQPWWSRYCFFLLSTGVLIHQGGLHQMAWGVNATQCQEGGCWQSYDNKCQHYAKQAGEPSHSCQKIYTTTSNLHLTTSLPGLQSSWLLCVGQICAWDQQNSF